MRQGMNGWDNPGSSPTRAYTPRFCISTFTLQPIYFQSTDLLSDCLISSGLKKNGIYFSLFFTNLGGHACSPVGHLCPPRLATSTPWWLKGESRSAKPRCIRARGLSSPETSPPHIRIMPIALLCLPPASRNGLHPPLISNAFLQKFKIGEKYFVNLQTAMVASCP